MATYDNQKARNQFGYGNQDNLSPEQTPNQSVPKTGMINSQPTASRTDSRTDYRDGYTQGRLSEQRVYQDQQTRDNDNAARGLLMGVLLAGLVGVTVGTVLLVNSRDRAPSPNITNIVPRVSPSPNQSPQVRERIVERDRVVPVPQEPAPTPNVNVTIPTQPAPQQVAPTQPEVQSNPQSTAPTQPQPANGQ